MNPENESLDRLKWFRLPDDYIANSCQASFQPCPDGTSCICKPCVGIPKAQFEVTMTQARPPAPPCKLESPTPSNGSCRRCMLANVCYVRRRMSFDSAVRLRRSTPSFNPGERSNPALASG